MKSILLPAKESDARQPAANCGEGIAERVVDQMRKLAVRPLALGRSESIQMPLPVTSICAGDWTFAATMRLGGSTAFRCPMWLARLRSFSRSYSNNRFSI